MSEFPTIAPQPSEQGQPGLHIQKVGFERSDELEHVAQTLIDRHDRLRPLEDFRIGYLLHHTDPPKRADKHEWAHARKVSGWATALCPFDGALVVNAPVWQVLNERHREALVLHELLHFDRDEQSGDLVLVGHDIEEFAFVAATYGAWRPSIRDFAEQLSLALPRDA